MLKQSHVEDILATFSVTPAECDLWVGQIEAQVDGRVKVDPGSGTVFLRHLTAPADTLQIITNVAGALTEPMRKHPPTGIGEPGDEWVHHSHADKLAGQPPRGQRALLALADAADETKPSGDGWPP